MCELGGLVEHRVAGEQRRHEHVAADEVRIIPGRDVRDHAERLVRDALLELLLLVGEDFFLTQRALPLGDKEVEPCEQSLQLVARLADRFADFPGQRAGERFLHRDDALAERGDRLESPRDRSSRPPWLRGTRPFVFPSNGGRPILRDVGDQSVGGGVEYLHARRDLACSRKSSRIGVSSTSEASPRSWNSGCHCTANTYEGPLQRSASAR